MTDSPLWSLGGPIIVSNFQSIFIDHHLPEDGIPLHPAS
jgi:hypothetical protein